MAQPTSGYLYSRNLVEAKASTTVSSTANTTGVDISQFKSNGVTFVFHCSATAGAGSLAIAVEESDAVGGTYAAVTDATITVNAAGVSLLFASKISKPFVRLAQTLTGTSVTYSALVYGDPGDATTSQGFTVSPQS